MKYTIERKLVHGVWVDVKVYKPSRRGCPKQTPKTHGVEQRGALHVARERELKI
jgi:hypothetical protein